jgi:CubicO group peptidase (beta-lactamase class C family)
MTKAEELGFSSARLARIEPFLRKHYIESGEIPGALTMILRRDEVAHLGMAGAMDLADGRPVTADTIYRIFSMTKPIASLALMMLVEEGLVALDDPVVKFIPAWKSLGVFSGGVPGAFITTPPVRAMLVIDLLRHTSGLTYGIMNRTIVDAAYRDRNIGDPNTPGGLKTMVEQLASLPLEFSPGEMWNYSLASDVVGYLVEEISGQGFRDFVRARILTPLEMHDTDFFVPPEKRGRLARCYEAKSGRLTLWDDGRGGAFSEPPPLISGGAGLCGTAGDYMEFCRMLLAGGVAANGRRLISPKTLALMTMNHLPGNREMTDMMPATGLFSEAGYAGIGFGLGFAVNMNVARTALPGTVGEYFWGGAALTSFWVDPKEALAVVFMTQVLGAPRRTRLRRDLRTLVYAAMTESFA